MKAWKFRRQQLQRRRSGKDTKELETNVAGNKKIISKRKQQQQQQQQQTYYSNGDSVDSGEARSDSGRTRRENDVAGDNQRRAPNDDPLHSPYGMNGRSQHAINASNSPVRHRLQHFPTPNNQSPYAGAPHHPHDNGWYGYAPGPAYGYEHSQDYVDGRSTPRNKRSPRTQHYDRAYHSGHGTTNPSTGYEHNGHRYHEYNHPRHQQYQHPQQQQSQSGGGIFYDTADVGPYGGPSTTYGNHAPSYPHTGHVQDRVQQLQRHASPIPSRDPRMVMEAGGYGYASFEYHQPQHTGAYGDRTLGQPSYYMQQGLRHSNHYTFQQQQQQRGGGGGGGAPPPSMNYQDDNGDEDVSNSNSASHSASAGASVSVSGNGSASGNTSSQLSVIYDEREDSWTRDDHPSSRSSSKVSHREWVDGKADGSSAASSTASSLQRRQRRYMSQFTHPSTTNNGERLEMGVTRMGTMSSTPTAVKSASVKSSSSTKGGGENSTSQESSVNGKTSKSAKSKGGSVGSKTGKTSVTNSLSEHPHTRVSDDAYCLSIASGKTTLSSRSSPFKKHRNPSSITASGSMASSLSSNSGTKSSVKSSPSNQHHQASSGSSTVNGGSKKSTKSAKSRNSANRFVRDGENASQASRGSSSSSTSQSRASKFGLNFRRMARLPENREMMEEEEEEEEESVGTESLGKYKQATTAPEQAAEDLVRSLEAMGYGRDKNGELDLQNSVSDALSISERYKRDGEDASEGHRSSSSRSSKRRNGLNATSFSSQQSSKPGTGSIRSTARRIQRYGVPTLHEAIVTEEVDGDEGAELRLIEPSTMDGGVIPNQNARRQISINNGNNMRAAVAGNGHGNIITGLEQMALHAADGASSKENTYFDESTISTKLTAEINRKNLDWKRQERLYQEEGSLHVDTTNLILQNIQEQLHSPGAASPTTMSTQRMANGARRNQFDANGNLANEASYMLNAQQHQRLRQPPKAVPASTSLVGNAMNRLFGVIESPPSETGKSANSILEQQQQQQQQVMTTAPAQSSEVGMPIASEASPNGGVVIASPPNNNNITTTTTTTISPSPSAGLGGTPGSNANMTPNGANSNNEKRVDFGGEIPPSAIYGNDMKSIISDISLSIPPTTMMSTEPMPGIITENGCSRWMDQVLLSCRLAFQPTQAAVAASSSSLPQKL